MKAKSWRLKVGQTNSKQTNINNFLFLDALEKKKRRIVQETEIGLAIIHCSTEFFCNPEKLASELLRPGENAHLKITKSKQLVPNTESGTIIFQNRPRRSPRKATQALSHVETIDLGSDDDMDGGNKENRTVLEGQASVSIGETQASGEVQSLFQTPALAPAEPSKEISIPETPIDTSNRSLPETQVSFTSAVLADEVEAPTNIADTHSDKRSTRASSNQSLSSTIPSSVASSTKNPRKRQISKSPEEEFKKAKKQDPPAVQETSSNKSDLFSFTTPSSVASSSKTPRKRKICESPEEELKKAKAKKQAPQTVENPSSNKSELFNFTNSSSSVSSTKNLRKRQNSESPEEKAKKQSVQSKSMATRRSTRKQLSSSEDDDAVPNPQPSASRKRKSTTGNGAGLFAFSNNFAKKSRPAEETQESPNEISGIVPLQKTRVSSPIYDNHAADSNNSIDSGVWLTKRMTSVKLSDSVDGIKSEQIELNEEASVVADTQDIKLSTLKTLFIVEENSIFVNKSSSVLSKRKGFVKKQNFSPQTSVVTMKQLNVFDTRRTLDQTF